MTIRQPWASLVCCGAKRYETRSWPTPKTLRAGDLLAVHAGLWEYTDEHMRYGYQSPMLCELRSYLDESPLFDGDSAELPMGAVLCVCRFLGCKPTKAISNWLPRSELVCGDFRPGRYAWDLDVVLRFQEPIPARGRQGLWWWDAPAWVEAPLRIGTTNTGGNESDEMAKFRKRPVVIEAIQFDGTNEFALGKWMGLGVVQKNLDGSMPIETLEGTMSAAPGYWIIRGVQGEFYPCKPDIFAATYEPVEED